MKSEEGSQSLLGIFGIVVCSACALVLAQGAATLIEQRQLGNLAAAVALDAADLALNEPSYRVDEQALRQYASSTLIELSADPRALDVLRPRITDFRLENTSKVVLRLCADNRFAHSPVSLAMAGDLAEVCVATAAQNVQTADY
jgi:hypothetical protein